jgi:WD40 repeat protein
MRATRDSGRWLPLLAVSTLLLAAFGLIGVGAAALGDELDPARNLALPCEAVSTPGLPPRSARNIVHVANVCGFVGTDIEFQSRTDATGRVRDYAFVGSMGAGTRIIEVTDPAHPRAAGAYLDPGWENDLHVRGDLLVVAFDDLVVGPHISACLKEKNPTLSLQRGGFDIVRLSYDRTTGNFQTRSAGCFLSQLSGGGTHTVTIHPSGEWVSSNTSGLGIEVVDVRGATPTRVRHIPRSVVDQAHDVSFSSDGNTLYSAGISSTRIADVTDIFNREPTLIGTVPNAATAAQGADGQTIAISHQSDTSSDGSIFIVTDEAGGGLQETRCNEGADGKVGGAHFWALAPLDGVGNSAGASPSSPKKLGTWVSPNPLLSIDPLAPLLAQIGRTERACTIHVFRPGGNGSAGPGPIQAGFDGVSRLPAREFVTAHYGAGVWHVDFSAAPTSADGTVEDSRTSWGNTLGWSVMPGADTWSAKEYKGFIYTGDMGRGFDVYGFTRCENLGCVGVPVNTPGRASGGGQTTNDLAELLILRGTSAGGTANFGFGVEYVAGRPSGDLTFNDKGAGTKLRATSIDTFVVDPAGRSATFTGTANVDGVDGVLFTVKVEDLGEPGTADTFSIAFEDYVASGVLRNGNVQVRSGSG